jgi:catechol 2,3-dioxygenase-like lactoylglutathione lyase family enzyme
MEKFISGLVKDFEAGKISRRDFCEAVALAAVVYGAGDAAKAAPAKGLKMLGVNHISYSCDDYRKARDFYAKTTSMQVLNDNSKNRANLAFGAEPGKGGAFLVARNFGANQSHQPGPSQVDHICYTIANWNDQRLMASLTAAGTKPVDRNPGGNSINIFDPNHYQVQLASIVGENAWRK